MYNAVSEDEDCEPLGMQRLRQSQSWRSLHIEVMFLLMPTTFTLIFPRILLALSVELAMNPDFFFITDSDDCFKF